MTNISYVKPQSKSGEEEFIIENESINYFLKDFWKWSASDLLNNITRGKLAEFIVATALGYDKNQVRDEWDAYDLDSTDGIKIEVKSASYIQSWAQKDFSVISFSIKKSLWWDSNTNKFGNVAKRWSDVYVFCLLKHKNKDSINPLQLEQWEFYVLPTKSLDNYERSQSSITLKSLQNLTKEVGYLELNRSIHAAYVEQKRHKTKL